MTASRTNTDDGLECIASDLDDLGSDDALVSVVTDLVEHVATIEERVTELEEENERLRNEKQRLTDRVSDLEEHGARSARDRAEVRADLAELEETVETAVKGGGFGDDTTPDTGGPARQDPETPLEETIRLPDHVAEESLTANQRRARAVAKDVTDYATSVPAGYALRSSELRTVLTALSDDEGQAYTETVGRVMNYLEDLGDDDVEVRETSRGERSVVFTDELVKRLVAWRNQSRDGRNSVVATSG